MIAYPQGVGERAKHLLQDLMDCDYMTAIMADWAAGDMAGRFPVVRPASTGAGCLTSVAYLPRFPKLSYLLFSGRRRKM